jgi:hypothetical protein
MAAIVRSMLFTIKDTAYDCMLYSEFEIRGVDVMRREDLT